MDLTSTQYRNLADWPETAWETLDIHLFIAANFTRYCTNLIKKVGLQYLPSDASDSLLGLFCDVAYKPLKSVHQKNLDAAGERRNQIMLGTLKMITFTRMVEALIREFPSYITLEQVPEAGDEEQLPDFAEQDEILSSTFSLPEQRSSLAPLYAADTDFLVFDTHEQDDDLEESRVSMMIEVLRSYLTPVQYRHIRYSICEGLDAQEIAERTGCSITNVRIMLLNARKRMLDLVPPHLQVSMQDYLHRR